MREVTLLLTYLWGYFENRPIWPSYMVRIQFYIILGSMYFMSKKRPRIKRFLPILLTVFYAVIFISNSPLNARREWKETNDYYAIGPVWFIVSMFETCFEFSTKFWISGYIIIPLQCLFYLFCSFSQRLFLKDVTDFYYIVFPNFCLISQGFFFICYITELK